MYFLSFYLLFVCLMVESSINFRIVLIHYLTLLSVLVFFACGNDRSKTSDLIAQVGEKTLTTKNIGSVLSLPASEKKRASKVIQEWVDTTILYVEAEKAGVTKDSQLIKKRNAFYKNLVVSSYINTLAEKTILVTKEDIGSYYKKNGAGFLRKEDEVYAAHYTTDNQSSAKQLVELLFSKSSRGLADTSMFTKETGTIKRGQLIKKLENPLFLKKQNVVGPIKADGLYHVFNVFNKYKKGSQKDLAGCYDEIYQRLFKKSVAERRIFILDSLKQVANIYINPEYQ